MYISIKEILMVQINNHQEIISMCISKNRNKVEISRMQHKLSMRKYVTVLPILTPTYMGKDGVIFYSKWVYSSINAFIPELLYRYSLIFLLFYVP